MTKMHMAPPPGPKTPAKSSWVHMALFVFVVSFAAALAWML